MSAQQADARRFAQHLNIRNAHNPNVMQYLLDTFDLDVNAVDSGDKAPLNFTMRCKTIPRSQMSSLRERNVLHSTVIRQEQNNDQISKKRRRYGNYQDPRNFIKKRRS